MTVEYISEDELWDEWGVVQKAGGEMFDYEDVKHQPVEHVWTVVETGCYEDENWYASPGFHIVNTLGYILTRRAWTSGARDAIYFLHEDIDDGSRSVFTYQFRDADCRKLDGVLLLCGDSDGIEAELIQESCEEQLHFNAKQVGIPALEDDGSTGDHRVFHEFRGIRKATPEEAASLPLWGSLRELTCRFLKAGDHWDGSPATK